MRRLQHLRQALSRAWYNYVCKQTIEFENCDRLFLLFFSFKLCKTETNQKLMHQVTTLPPPLFDYPLLVKLKELHNRVNYWSLIGRPFCLEYASCEWDPLHKHTTKQIKGHQGGARQCSNVRKTIPQVYTWDNHVTKPIGCHNKPKMDRSKTVNDA